MAFNYSPKTVTSGLVFYLDPANPRSYPGSGTTWSDISKNSINGSLVNGPTYSSANLGSFVFDGTNDYYTASLNTPVSEANMSLFFSFKSLNNVDWTDFMVLITPNGQTGMLFEKGGNNGFPLTNGYFKVYPVGSTSLLDVATPGTFVTDSNIHCFAMTSNSSNWYLYDNGIMYGSGSISGSAITYSGLVLANDPNRVGRYRNCQIYNLLVYNRSLSATEVLQNYNATRARFGL